jgi:hypothetical protein
VNSSQVLSDVKYSTASHPLMRNSISSLRYDNSDLKTTSSDISDISNKCSSEIKFSSESYKKLSDSEEITSIFPSSSVYSHNYTHDSKLFPESETADTIILYPPSENWDLSVNSKKTQSISLNSHSSSPYLVSSEDIIKFLFITYFFSGQIESDFLLPSSIDDIMCDYGRNKRSSVFCTETHSVDGSDLVQDFHIFNMIKKVEGYKINNDQNNRQGEDEKKKGDGDENNLELQKSMEIIVDDDSGVSSADTEKISDEKREKELGKEEEEEGESCNCSESEPDEDMIDFIKNVTLFPSKKSKLQFETTDSDVYESSKSCGRQRKSSKLIVNNVDEAQKRPISFQIVRRESDDTIYIEEEIIVDDDSSSSLSRSYNDSSRYLPYLRDVNGVNFIYIRYNIYIFL